MKLSHRDLFKTLDLLMKCIGLARILQEHLEMFMPKKMFSIMEEMRLA